MPRQIDPGHRENRTVLRLIGPAVLGIGLLMTVIGFGSFFMSFASFGSPGESPGMPRYFWCVFVGMPLMFVGIIICKFAFLGAVSRYFANEVTPVGKDVVNYMADGTKDAVRDVAAAIGEGISSSLSDQETPVLRCHKCNENNETSAAFCKSCGVSLGKSVACSKCGELNDPDARFCDDCGQAVA